MQARRSREDTHQIAGGFNWDATNNLKVTAQTNYTTSKDSTDSHIVDAQYNLGPQGLTVKVNPNGDGAYYVSQPGDPQADPANTYHRPVVRHHQSAQGPRVRRAYRCHLHSAERILLSGAVRRLSL